LFDFDNLRGASNLLKGTNILHNDFQSTLKDVNNNDLIFLDPPYTVAHENNGFIKYNQRIFDWHDQERLASTIKMVGEKGAFYILTNAAHPSIQKLFESGNNKEELGRYSVIGGKKAKREIKNEYVFFNHNKCPFGRSDIDELNNKNFVII
jgi:DNA adenine methylase